MKRIKVTKKDKEILKETERRISEEIFCIAETILEEDTKKTKGKIRGIINKYIIKRFAREKRLRKYGLDLDVTLEMKTEMKEATFNLGYK